MHIERFFVLVSFFVGLSVLQTARAEDERTWIERGFKPATPQYKYFVGVSAPFGNVLDATSDARKNATILLVNQEFSTNSNISLRTAETANAVVIENHSLTELKDVDLTNFELEDQQIETIQGDLPHYVVKALYRYERARLDKERTRLLANQNKSDQIGNYTNDKSMQNELQKATADKIQREADLNAEIATWKSVFPLVGADLNIGYQGFKDVDLVSLGFGARLRLPYFNRIYIGGFYSYGAGSDRTPTGTSGGSYDTDTASRLGIDTRIYLIRDPREGLYLHGLASLDQVHRTCSKNSVGACTSPSTPDQHGNSFGGGIGAQLNSKHGFYWIEANYAVDSNPAIGRSIWAGLGITWGVVK
ncbi:MAG: hypothetical protein JNL01_03180 [Bdellovibrionales bacterium]|nr:hypothetical protein [Bdellovibrionales bacterium]